MGTREETKPGFRTEGIDLSEVRSRLVDSFYVPPDAVKVGRPHRTNGKYSVDVVVKDGPPEGMLRRFLSGTFKGVEFKPHVEITQKTSNSTGVTTDYGVKYIREKLAKKFGPPHKMTVHAEKGKKQDTVYVEYRKGGLPPKPKKSDVETELKKYVSELFPRTTDTKVMFRGHVVHKPRG